MSWPDLLAQRLAGSKAVVNEGIAGNQITGGVSDAVGQPALVRIANDVLGRAGATHVIFLEGTNDIFAANPTEANWKDEVATLKAAYQRIIDDAHLIGLNIIGATILPRGADTKNWTRPMENVRSALNTWITSTAPFDNHIDFEELMTTPPDTTTSLPSITPNFRCPDGDGVHPNALGYKAMADYITKLNTEINLFNTPLRAR
jgi:lysophospholipase L1-like esterase